MMWKKIRIFILLLVFGAVVQQTMIEQSDLDWDRNFYVAVYPINADGTTAVDHYISTLTKEDFEPIAEYFSEEAKRFGLTMRRPFQVQLGAKVLHQPPAPPKAASVLDTITWSLKFRYFAWKNSP